MTDKKDEIKEEWLQILDNKISELRDVLNKCVEYQTVILRSHLFIEQILDKIIELELTNPNYVLDKSNLTFLQKLHLVRGFDQINKEIYDQISYLNQVRNKYAHDLNYELDSNEISNLGRTLGKSKFKENKNFSDNDLHLLVLIVHDICKNSLIIYSLNEGADRYVKKQLNNG